jgi:peroxiredoxin family protein
MKDTSRRRLSVVLFSGDYDRVHYSLAIASAAAAIDRPVSLFLTGNGLKLILDDFEGVPGWSLLGNSENGQSALKRDQEHSKNGICTIDATLKACVELNVKFYRCEMGIVIAGLNKKGFRDDLPLKPGGLGTFLSEAEKDGGQIIFI